MNRNLFNSTLEENAPPVGISPALKGLWYDKNGEWDKAHEMIQDESDADSAWVHAYLHRKEGDLFNADYWYRRAGKSRSPTDFDQEWEQLVSALTK
jgi:hypothetical protein